MPFLRWTESFPPRPGPELPPRRLEHDGLIDPGRLPSTRSSTLRSRDASLRSRLGLRTSASHPFTRRGVIPPCRGKNLRDVLPRAFSVCLSAPLDGVRKMLLADFCNRLTTRAPVDRLIPERGACASPTAATRRAETRERLRRQPVFRRPGPRWSALDGAVPSFGIFDHSHSLPVAERWGWSRGQTHGGGCHLAAALSTACQVGEVPLTLSVAPRALPDRVDPTRFEAPRTASPAPSSKGAASSIQSAFHRQVAPKESRLRTTVFGGNPPPVSRLCRRGPGFRRAFAAPMLSPGVARPDVGSRGSSPRVATGQTPPVDFCNLLRSASTSDGSSEPRAPRLWSPTCAALFSSHRLSTAERIAGGGACYGTANRDVTGQGPALERFAH